MPSSLCKKPLKVIEEPKVGDLKILEEFKKTQEKMFANFDKKALVFAPQHLKSKAKPIEFKIPDLTSDNLLETI